MADSTPTFNIFGDPTKDDIKVGYISTDRGFVSGVGICEANDYAKLNPGTVFIFKNREEIKYIDINDVNKLTVNDLDLSEECGGIEIDKVSSCNPTVETFGGAGLGVLANPVVGEDGSIIAVDVVEGGFGYQSEPSAVIKDPCSIGAGAELRVEMVENEAAVELEYDDEDDFEEYEICNDDNNVGFGRRYDPNGKDIGEWNPALYLDDGTLSFDEQLKKYSDFLLTAPNPWWTTRTEPPLRTTSEGKISRAKYDVYHWAWGAKPGENDPIDNLYIKLFGRRGEPSGLDYWRDRIASGKNLNQIEDEMKTMPEWKEVCEGKCKPVMPDVTYLAGSYWEYDKNNFMNKYAISPVPMSNVVPSDFGGQEHYFEWDIDFPHSGDYIFKFQCDNEGALYIDGEKKGEYQIGQGGAAGNVLSPPETTKVGLTTGFHTVRVDVFNGQPMKKVAEQQKLDALATSDEVKFDVQVATLYGASATIEGLDISFAKTYGEDKSVNESVTKKVEYGRVYDVKITSDTIRSESSTSTIGGSYPLIYTKLKDGSLRRKSNRRLEYDDSADNIGFDRQTNEFAGAFTIDNVTGGTAKFSSDGSSIEVQGDEVKVTLTYNWDDNPRRSGRVLETIAIKDTIWRQLNWRPSENRWVVESIGSHTYTVTLAGKTTSTSSKTIGGANNGAVLRTKGDTVLQMEDIPNTDAGGGGVGQYWDDVIISVSQGRFFDINGMNAKYVLEKQTKTVMQGGTGSGTVKDGVVYDGPELFHKNFSGWGSFMNKSSVCQNPTVANTQVVNYTWSNVDFPEDGIYQVKFQNDAHATLYLDGEPIVTGNFDNEAGVSAQDESNWSGSGKYKNVPVNKGKHTLTVGPPNPDLIDTLFKQPAGYEWHKNPSGFAIEIRKKMKVVRTGADGKPVTKSWKENPVLVSAHLIPPPCPRVVEGKGSVDKIIPVVPGNGYSPPPTGGGDPRYDVLLELTNVIIEDPGINYDPDDEVVITGGPGDPVIPPFKPVPGPFGTIIDIPVPPNKGIGFTKWPDISISTSTGIGFVGTPVFTVRRTPPLVDPDRLLQVTDLVGLKQTGYYDGKPYYGAIFYKEGIKYAGWYETAGQLVQVYDTLQESIDAMVTTPASAIQRQGSDISSNDPRLNIPGTPDNLTY